MGFCLQDTYFKTWQDDKPAAREQLAGLLYRDDQGGRRASPCPFIEPGHRGLGAGQREGRVPVCHQPRGRAPETTVRLADLGFEIGQIVDLAGGQAVRFTEQKGGVELSLSVPLGQTRLLHMLGK